MVVMRCEAHCPPDGGFPVLAALASLAVCAAVSLAVYVVTSSWPLLLAAVLALGVLGAAAAWGVSKASRWAARLAVVRWPSMQGAGKVASGLPVVTARTRSITAPPLAIEPPRPVLDGVVVAEGETTKSEQVRNRRPRDRWPSATSADAPAT